MAGMSRDPNLRPSRSKSNSNPLHFDAIITSLVYYISLTLVSDATATEAPLASALRFSVLALLLPFHIIVNKPVISFLICSMYISSHL